MTPTPMPNVALTDYYEKSVESLSSDFFRACSALGLDKELRLFACRCVRDTPLPDGRKVWDLLTDERSRKAVETAERYANGEATKEELDTAWDAASAAAWKEFGAADRAAFRAADRAADMAAIRAADRAAESAKDMVALWGEDKAAAWASAISAQRTFLREILPLDTFLAAAAAKGITKLSQLPLIP